MPERDAEGRLCTLIVPARMNLNPGIVIIIIIVILFIVKLHIFTNLNPGIPPEEFAAKLLRSVGFLMEACLDDPYEHLPLARAQSFGSLSVLFLWRKVGTCRSMAWPSSRISWDFHLPPLVK